MCLLPLLNLHFQSMADTLIVTLCKLQPFISLVRLHCSEPPCCISHTDTPSSQKCSFLCWLWGRGFNCYPWQLMSVNFSGVLGPGRKLGSVEDGTSLHRQLQCNRSSAKPFCSLRNHGKLLSPAESLLPSKKKKKKQHVKSF